tara:strand:- start:13937 stop:15190 length:1254 start_codon:yes stop_codon:yes gene_type:complete
MMLDNTLDQRCLRIGIPNFASTFLPFFINLAKYLEALGHSVIFLNPDPFLRSQLDKHGCCYELYPPIKNTCHLSKPFDKDSDIIKYLSRLYRLNKSQEMRLITTKNNLFSRASQQLSSYPVDKIIMWNGLGNVEKTLCQTLNIDAFYCENGYFENTFQMNKRGVNSDGNFVDLEPDQLYDFTYPNATLPFTTSGFKITNTPFNKFYYYLKRVFDSDYRNYLLSMVQYNLAVRKAKRSFNEQLFEKVDFDKIGKFVFIPLQVNSDTQTILYSDFKDSYDFLSTVIPKLKQLGFHIVLKQHPFETEPVDYSSFVCEQVSLFSKCDLNALIDRAEFVVTINSSVGLQAIERGKKVVACGAALYKNAPNCYSLTALDKVEEAPLQDANKYITKLKRDIFIKGNWREVDESLLASVSQRLLG